MILAIEIVLGTVAVVSLLATFVLATAETLR